MPRSLLTGEDEPSADSSQVVNADFLSPNEHTAIGNDPPHHTRFHAIESQADHGITGTPSDGQILVFRLVDGNWHTENPAAGGLSMKSGIVAGASFAGTPKKATVTFATAFTNTDYAFIVLSSVDSRGFVYESKAAGSIVINSGSGAALSGEVSWIAIENGEN